MTRTSLFALVVALLAFAASAPSSRADRARPTASVSVEIRSSCSRPVKIKYDSTIAKISSGEVDRRSLDVGDEVAVLDDGEHELDSITVRESTRELAVGSDCTSIRER